MVIVMASFLGFNFGSASGEVLHPKASIYSADQIKAFASDICYSAAQHDDHGFYPTPASDKIRFLMAERYGAKWRLVLVSFSHRKGTEFIREYVTTKDGKATAFFDTQEAVNRVALWNHRMHDCEHSNHGLKNFRVSSASDLGIDLRHFAESFAQMPSTIHPLSTAVPSLGVCPRPVALVAPCEPKVFDIAA
jgi:hypothetical protein